MFRKILMANRGEIACRMMRTAHRLGISTVAVYSNVDRNAQHVKQADEAFALFETAFTSMSRTAYELEHQQRDQQIPQFESRRVYLQSDAILDIAKRANVDAIHPGYGFLSENANFARACEREGIVFIGPSSTVIEQMASKSLAKQLMVQAGVPVVPGYHGDDQSLRCFEVEAQRIGYPVLLKAVSGGGGKGMRLVERPCDLASAYEQVQREAMASFNDGRILIEKYLENPRHIEMQLLADQQGSIVYLFERDCSIQRRYQKIIEEAPAPGFTEAQRARMGQAAVDAAKAIHYSNAGTIEFLYHDDQFYFMEMNTAYRLSIL